MTLSSTAHPLPPIAFIGGGNMAGAILGGLRRAGLPASQFEVVEPFAATRERLAAEQGVQAQATAGTALQRCALVVWAVKPQVFAQAAADTRAFLAPGALHLSVAAGIPSDSIARWLGSEHVVRAMPNTPALVGQGMTGLYARPAVDAPGRAQVEQLLQPTGRLLWVEAESALDAVTALSGSGPAYVFYFIESMVAAGIDMGLTPEQAHALAVGTFTGASALAAASQEPPATLRERVTSKGGTTHAAISALEAAQVKALFGQAIRAAEQRARELAQEFGQAS
ncbi:pyrroline-5-carboxylate reductase [Xenophilus arseniciresistens]|uniref:Pyrroline-5-carboxylate reductase n=1 Tax=Xenophilus arseniciresistens TaxID=1283306 RepID=A0AAE3NER4_9BURK|nr:pyrroline-5-carboxylate reductase [Xenophilus arseniciresistens]MDA7418947.1 pyrroline-5-carboxylate reductase [Xenophilus arseniciresistens]